jgi:cytochrome P450
VVNLVCAAANRDPHQFDDPDEFSFERSNVRQHLGFGLGIHYCVGAPVARLESQVALEVLTTRMPELRLAHDFSPTYEPHAMLHGLTELMVES